MISTFKSKKFVDLAKLRENHPNWSSQTNWMQDLSQQDPSCTISTKVTTVVNWKALEGLPDKGTSTGISCLKDANWSSQNNWMQNLSQQDPFDNISRTNVVNFVNSKVLERLPDEETLSGISCLKDGGLSATQDLIRFVLHTETQIDIPKIQNYVKHNQRDFYIDEVYTPTADFIASDRITSFYSAFNQLDLNQLLHIFSASTTRVADTLSRIVNDLWIQQISYLCEANPLFLGIIFMPIILCAVGFKQFWGGVFPYLLREMGNISCFISEVQTKLVALHATIPKTVSYLGFLAENKWTLLTGFVCSSYCVVKSTYFITLIIEPLIESTNEVVIKPLIKSTVEDIVKPAIKSSVDSIIRSMIIPAIEAFMEQLGYIADLSADYRFKLK